ncbi:hypothetical protein [Chitinilyticum piscinae]|uniref:Uncharacterized protein n=1 Tax=Chitinilyticum piscinae TaxID=2866724 RepID=A0A8J7FJA5_9NEIS|nr:hypothetical protein [Chitinilyticum piscinae]MBE9607874.1 hypothetical protein [Chitinilyticum piscinae]
MPLIELDIQSTLPSQPESRLQLPWLHGSIRADELIHLTVLEQCRILTEREQLDAAQAQQRIARQYLSEADIAHMRQHGRVALQATADLAAPAPDLETAIALEAFRRRRFLLLVGERQIRAEDDIITLNPHQPIRFVRLIPLQGG